jgi:hypothetical protein
MEVVSRIRYMVHETREAGKSTKISALTGKRRQDSLIAGMQHAKRHVRVGTFCSHESSKSGGLQAWRMTQNAMRSSEGWIHA